MEIVIGYEFKRTMHGESCLPFYSSLALGKILKLPDLYYV